MKTLQYLLLPITFPISLVYGFVVYVRNKLYDFGFIKSIKFNVPVICVGNITVGGTGKTPHIEYLLSILQENTAVVSRGYKRKSKGFRYVAQTNDAQMCGDEPLQIKRKFPNTTVAVEVKREEAITQILHDFSNTKAVLLDDAFQYRKVKAGLNIILIDYNRPVWHDMLLPAGLLRDSVGRLSKAQIVVITKCPSDISEAEKNKILSKKCLKTAHVFFSSFKYNNPKPIFGNSNNISRNATLTAVAGIANPTPFFAELEKTFDVKHKISYPDHYNFTDADVAKFCELTYNTEYLITTEKDAVRLLIFKNKIPEKLKSKFFYLPIEVSVDNSFAQMVRTFVAEAK